METPAVPPTLPRKARTQPLVSMVNQVTLEGYLVRAWIHEPYRYLRIANQRPPELGGHTGGKVPVESDYITIRLDPSVPFDMQSATHGLHLLVHGRMEGRDIPETIGDILSHCKVHVALPREIAALQVTRPTVQVCCTTLEFRYPSLPRAGQGDRYWDHRDRRLQQVEVMQPAMTDAATTQSSDPSSAQTSSEPAGDSLQPGEDAAETSAQLDMRRAASRSDPLLEVGKRAAEEPEKKGRVKKK